MPLEALSAGRGDAMTTVAVVAILAAIAIPAYQDYVIRAQVAEGSALAEGSKVAVAEYYANSGKLPHDNAQAGVADAASITGNYVSSVKIDDGRITVTYGNKANAPIRDEVLMFVPAPEEGVMRWSCGSAAGTTIASKYRPAACRP
ncbi:MAG: pilin [Proteobacteria bacterium]|nr:pilin [Pseudomonadota bacterium]